VPDRDREHRQIDEETEAADAEEAERPRQHLRQPAERVVLDSRMCRRGACRGAALRIAETHDVIPRCRRCGPVCGGLRLLSF
jgi:hypothetical protein